MKWSTSFPLPQTYTQPEELKQLLDRAESELKNRLGEDARLGRAVRLWKDSGSERLKIESPWITGALFFSPTHLHIDVQLSFAAWAFRSQIEGILKSWVNTCRIP